MDNRADLLERSIQANRHHEHARHVIDYLRLRLEQHMQAMVSEVNETTLRQQQGMAMELKKLIETFTREPRKPLEG